MQKLSSVEKFHGVASPQSGDATLHSALMFAALMIGHHFSISAFCWAASASGVCCSRGHVPWRYRRSAGARPGRPKFPHSFRFVGLAFLVKGVVAPELPAAFAVPAAYGDLIAAVLALLALAALRSRFGIPLVWIFNLWGSADLFYAFYQGNASRLVHGFGVTGFERKAVLIRMNTVCALRGDIGPMPSRPREVAAQCVDRSDVNLVLVVGSRRDIPVVPKPRGSLSCGCRDNGAEAHVMFDRW
jgi:hypothetical protein